MSKIVLDGVVREVALERTPEGVVVVVDGRRHAVRDVTVLTNSVAFFAGDESCVALVSNDASGTYISLRGHTYHRTTDSPDMQGPARGGSGPHDGRITAPMPGVVIALNVKPGDRVTAGQPLVVLESMKMHNEITSPGAGVVQHVACKPGDQVAFGYVLVEIGMPQEKE